MKLAMVTGSLSRDAGGLFESVRALGKALAESGLDVSVHGLRDQNWKRDEMAWEPLSARAFSFIGPRAMAWSPDMDAALDRMGPDLCALQGLWQYSSIATRRQWRRRGTPYVVSPRGMLDKWALANSRWKKVLAALAFERAVLRDASCLHALCQSEADAMRAYGLRQRIEVVPNGAELPKISTTERTEGRKRLLFLGRIHPKKGLMGALRAWAGLKREVDEGRFSEWQFVIAGWDQGGHESELKALCADLGLRIADGAKALDARPSSLESAEILFFGPAFGAEKEALLRSADAFVLPSHSEGLPMSVLEAWAYGLPVVMTPECNLPEGFAAGAALEIRNAETGNANWEGLRSLIGMIEDERVGMGLKGRRLVEERFSWPRVAAQMKSLYEDLLR